MDSLLITTANLYNIKSKSSLTFVVRFPLNFFVAPVDIDMVICPAGILLSDKDKGIKIRLITEMRK